MIHVVTSANRDQYEDQLDEMHRIRHQTYVIERGWKALRSIDGRERDEYDDDHAVYLLSLDDDQSVRGFLRLRRCDKGTLVGDHFADQVIDKTRIPTDADTWELTRWFQRAELRGARTKAVKLELICAMYEFGLSRGADGFLLACDAYFLPGVIRVGWALEHLSLPFDYGEGTAVLVRFPCDRAHLEMTRAASEIDRPLMAEAPMTLARDRALARDLVTLQAFAAQVRGPEARRVILAAARRVAEGGELRSG